MTEASTGLDPAEIPARMTGRMTAHPQTGGCHEAFLPSPCVQNHAANLHVLPDGTLACVWFAGTMEGMSDISIYMSRLAPGADTWSAPERLSDDPARSEQNPVLFTTPRGTVWLVFTAQTAGDQDGAIIRRRVSEDGGLSFGPVETLTDRPGTFVRQPPVFAADGTWLLPVFRCVSEPGRRWSGNIDTAGVLVSTDDGARFTLHDVPDSLGAVHMNIVPGAGGRPLAFFRNRFAEQVLRSVSADDGMTWSAPEPTVLPNNNSSIQAIRLGDGRIAMVHNPVNAAMSSDRRLSLYDEIDGDDDTTPAPASARAAIWGVPRAPLRLTILDPSSSRILHHRDLDTGDGYCLTNNSQDARNREYSYPSIVEGPDGALHIAYTYYRRAIKHVRLASPD
ncbi:sialidase family protein [Ensifer soli]|uniref:sialidase family protein n=1 Tax=Ciceribacter sp. sgz301302 TaxID=3342379 RepID=UPI0035B771CA